MGELALLLKEVVGYPGTVHFDASKPDGTPRKRLDVTRLQELGWKPSVSLQEGLAATYRWFLENHSDLRGMQPAAGPAEDLKPMPELLLDGAADWPRRAVG